MTKKPRTILAPLVAAIATIVAIVTSLLLYRETINHAATIQELLRQRDTTTSNVPELVDTALPRVSHADPSPAHQKPTITSPVVSSPAPTVKMQAPLEVEELVQMKVRAIEKFVPLNDDMKLRLEDKFRQEVRGDHSRSQHAESIDDILGAENAEFYRTQRREAFKRAETEALEKDVLYLSRQLSMNENQEQRLRQAYAEIETEVSRQMSELFKGTDVKNNRQLLLQKVLTENQLRNTLLAQQMQTILTAPQYDQFVSIQAESTDSDIEIWHGP